MNFDICLAAHIPIVYQINPNENYFGVLKHYCEYYCPECHREIKYKQKQCECGNKIFWILKKHDGQLYGVN